MRGLARGGTTLLLATQYIEEAGQLADTATIIDHGRIIASDTPARFKDELDGATGQGPLRRWRGGRSGADIPTAGLAVSHGPLHDCSSVDLRLNRDTGHQVRLTHRHIGGPVRSLL